MDLRLKTDIWARALIRKCNVQGVPAFVVRRGDGSAGIVLVKVNLLNGLARIYTPARRGDGTRIWMEGAGGGDRPEAEVDLYVQKQVSYDSDIWVIEVEDPQGRHFLDEPVE